MSLIILDRDGVINKDSDSFIKNPAEWEPIAGSLEAIARLGYAGYRVVVITNQSGIARGLFDATMLSHIHSKMRRMVGQLGGKIDAIFYCSHGPDSDCRCRKPDCGAYESLSQRLRVDLSGVPAVGDALRDIQAAQHIQAQPILVKTGKGRQTIANPDFPPNVPVYDDLAAVTEALLERKRI
ncbi:MAG TPA: D-glycero-beta-D-manno-heptose-1,7-bisphosphate 7-phosphatase [Gammaproteobacteria bacterium]|nr:D-glycero-beta-D-manno-heptose-1,7-bisphosphate 7-phosphatase [Gammaproteobacteria bacterium]